MMSAGKVCLLGLVLCTVILSTSAQKTGSKPGVCPPERYFNTSYIEKCPALCTDDSSCTGDKKCCLDNCYKFCKPPAKERPGSCPEVKDTAAKRCDDYCTSDSECPDGSKCCMGTCGKTCLPSVGVKPGKCSQEEYACLVAERNLCPSDSSCPGKEKCCPNVCRKACE